jgi:hypothetical protein
MVGMMHMMHMIWPNHLRSYFCQICDGVEDRNELECEYCARASLEEGIGVIKERDRASH